MTYTSCFRTFRPSAGRHISQNYSLFQKKNFRVKNQMLMFGNIENDKLGNLIKD